MKIQDWVTGIFILILIYLLVVNWRGANALLSTGAGASIGIVKTLQGR